MTRIGQPVPELPVTDLEATRTYYCEKLGFKREWAIADMATVSRGNVAIFFRLSKESISPQSHWIFAKEVDATYEEMRSAEADIPDPISDKPYGLRQFTVRDPNGHLFYVHCESPESPE